MVAAAVPLLYNRLRLDHVDEELDPTTAASVNCRFYYVAWSTAGDVNFFHDAVLLTDGDPTAAIAAGAAAFDTLLTGAGFTLALDPSDYSP